MLLTYNNKKGKKKILRNQNQNKICIKMINTNQKVHQKLKIKKIK